MTLHDDARVGDRRVDERGGDVPPDLPATGPGIAASAMKGRFAVTNPSDPEHQDGAADRPGQHRWRAAGSGCRARPAPSAAGPRTGAPRRPSSPRSARARRRLPAHRAAGLAHAVGAAHPCGRQDLALGADRAPAALRTASSCCGRDAGSRPRDRSRPGVRAPSVSLLLDDVDARDHHRLERHVARVGVARPRSRRRPASTRRRRPRRRWCACPAATASAPW